MPILNIRYARTRRCILSTATLEAPRSVRRSGMHEPNRRTSFNLSRGMSPLRRRLADAVDEAFRLALAKDDLSTAEGLLDVLQNMRARDRVVRHVERRHADPLIDLARRELDSRKSGRRRNL